MGELRNNFKPINSFDELLNYLTANLNLTLDKSSGYYDETTVTAEVYLEEFYITSESTVISPSTNWLSSHLC